MITSQLLFALDAASILAGFLLGARILVRHPRSLNAQLIALITTNTICYVVLSRYEYGAWIAPPYRYDLADAWIPLLNLARNLTPGLFMILCFRVFADRKRLPPWLMVLFAVQVFLEVPAHWILPSGGLFGATLFRIAPATLEAMFAGCALYWTIANWPSDLVEGRRRARAIIVVLIGLNMIGATIFLRVLIPQDTIANYYAHITLVAANLPVILFLLIFATDKDLDIPVEPEEQSAKPLSAQAISETAAALARLSKLMETDRVYRRPDLTLKDMAGAVGVPEYRLRKLINEELGYRNFNAFLHEYRIREACQQMRDPGMRRIPVLTIALSTGYQSINTFNRAFRETMDMTPTAYRALDPAPDPPQKPSPQTA